MPARLGAAVIPVLVTGGAGYIGSHTCKALARRGFVPIAVDNLSLGRREVAAQREGVDLRARQAQPLGDPFAGKAHLFMLAIGVQ